jgi:hypothetical protein
MGTSPVLMVDCPRGGYSLTAYSELVVPDSVMTWPLSPDHSQWTNNVAVGFVFVKVTVGETELQFHQVLK